MHPEDQNQKQNQTQTQTRERDRSQPIPAPAFLDETPTALAFGTSGLRGRVVEMTDLEVFINTTAFLRFLTRRGLLPAGGAVAFARDLRDRDPRSGWVSSPRIAKVVAFAIQFNSFRPIDCGCVPTPTLAFFASAVFGEKGASFACPAIMVTGSHIPADRNGIKFYRPDGEISKADEPEILEEVFEVRREEYAKSKEEALFDSKGFLKDLHAPRPSPVAAMAAVAAAAGGGESVIERADAVKPYVERYTQLFEGQRPLAGVRIVVYQHSAVGRDLLPSIFTALGADVVLEGRSDSFVAVDTEDVSIEEERLYGEWVKKHHAFALLSTDGDGDRPLLVDEQGRFHRGDVLGAVTAKWLGADYAALPVSTSDAVELYFHDSGLEIEWTRIGSPYVIAAMEKARAAGKQRVVAWEANGGFLLGSDFIVNGRILRALPTRDAVLPLLAALLSARGRGLRISEVFGALPPRATRAGLLDDFPRERAQALLSSLALGDGVLEVRSTGDGNLRVLTSSAGARVADAGESARFLEAARRLGHAFARIDDLGVIARINYVDGVRIYFSRGDILHLRASGNAPQFRMYVVSDRQDRADSIVEEAIREPDGLLRRLEKATVG